MHINNLPIPLIPTNNRRHNNQLILHDEIPYTPFILRGVARDSGEVESQRGRELRDEHEREEEGAEDGLHCESSPFLLCRWGSEGW